ncbi:MAG: hypothetical protein H8E85_00750 [Candidatus Marinimicrobia bacterium]|nr:hypothetical protein [Candidatus Neomarinimicrobiota bacterium]
MDEIYDNWVDNDYFVKITAVMDIGNPYSCEEWAGLGFPDIPSPLADDGIYGGGDETQIFNLFNTAQFSVHNHAIINHKMEVVYKSSSTVVPEINAVINHSIADCINEGDCVTEPCTSGDVNNDAILNVLDVVIMVNVALGELVYLECADLNNDDLVNVLDVVQLVNLILSTN